MPINTDPPYDRLETILMGGTVDPPYSRKELIAMQAGGGSGGGGGEGSGGGVLMIHGTIVADDSTITTTLDKTAAEIIQALTVNDLLPVLIIQDEDNYLSEYFVEYMIIPANPTVPDAQDEYTFIFRQNTTVSEAEYYVATSLNDYPVYSTGIE